jgi:hypothetical protein
MKQIIATGSSSIAHLFMGDSRLKRVALMIIAPKRGNSEFAGYALVNELNEKVFSFFCTDKFTIDEELEIKMRFGGHNLTYKVLMSHLHEQISSGRIMTDVPTEENPFPARKFYRCFSKVVELQGMEKTGASEENPASPVEPASVEPAKAEAGTPPESPIAGPASVEPASIEPETPAAHAA